MSTALDPPRSRRADLAPLQHFLLQDISWATYEGLVEDLGERHVRLIYNRGILELMSPSAWHERYRVFLCRFVADVLLGLRIPFEPAGQTTWRAVVEERGLEPDGCFFLMPESMAVIAGRAADHPGDPKPDLAIEIDWTNASVDRDPIYAALRVLEVWRFDGEALRIGRLGVDGSYAVVAESTLLPVRAEEVAAWVVRADGMIFSEWIEALREWVRDELAPRHEARRG